MASFAPQNRAVFLLLAVVGGLSVPLTTSAQELPTRPDQRTIRVTGTGEVQAQPDLAHIDLAVETFEETARAAGEENARIMEQVIQALVGAGIPRAEIETRGYSLFPEYEQQPRQQAEPPRIRGYRATNTVTVRTQDLARVGPLIDTALGAGANRLNAVRFSLEDAEAAQGDALSQAVRRARRSAETMAAALAVQLGEVVDASTTTELVRPMMHDMARMTAEAAQTTPIQPGEQTVTAIVSLVYAILPAAGAP